MESQGLLPSYNVEQHNEPQYRTRSSTYRTANTVPEAYFDEPGCTTPYRMCYNRLLEEKSSASKHVHVKEIVKN
jgi:hypothetical protein